MKVKVGNQVYDSHEEPIMIILSGAEKCHIEGMLPSAHKYLVYPEGWFTEDEAREWMKIEERD